MRKKLGTIIILVGCLCQLAAIGLLLFNKGEDVLAGETVKPVLRTLQTVEKEAQVQEQRLQDTALVEVVPNYQLAPDVPMPVEEINGNEYVGTISIPDINIELPVINEWNYPNLKIAPCRYKGSVYTRDMIIAAHNYKSHFGQLNQLVEGNVVVFTDLSGNVFTYEVCAIETIGKYGLDEMESGDWDLTLFTCTIGGENRVTVRCKLVE